MKPSKFFLTKGIGTGDYRLLAFEMALRDAGISPYNLVTVSSIIPPNCELISKEEGIKMIEHGSIVFLVLSRVDSSKKNERITASLGLAIPENRNHYGYISEYDDKGVEPEAAAKLVENMASTMLKSISDKEINFTLKSVVQSGIVKEKWMSVVSAAVFVP